MIHQCILFLFALSIVAVDAKPLRRRRQAPTALVALPVPCEVRCSWSFAKEWTKAIIFDSPTVKWTSHNFTSDRNDTFGVMCSLYDANQIRQRGCAASNSDAGDNDFSSNNNSTGNELCDNRTSQFDQYWPCLSQNAAIYRNECSKENAALLVASTRLVRMARAQIDQNVPRHFCTAAKAQAYCIFPIVHQTCGEGPSDLIRTLVNASLALIRQSVDDEVISAFYPECADYIATIQDGIPNATSAHHNLTTSQPPAIDGRAGHNATWTTNGHQTSSRRETATSSSTHSVMCFSSNFVFFVTFILFNFSM